MKRFGVKAFLRAFGIFVSVFLVKIGIEVFPKINHATLKVVFIMAIIGAILLILIAPNIFPSNKHQNTNEDRKTKE